MNSPLEGIAEALVVHPGDTLIVRTTGGDYDEEEHLTALMDDLRANLPTTKIVVMCGETVAQIGVARSEDG